MFNKKKTVSPIKVVGTVTGATLFLYIVATFGTIVCANFMSRKQEKEPILKFTKNELDAYLNEWFFGDKK